ncbi:MAG: LuxR C-terminal-related transcriptional regulator [Actinomycetota bacterium]|nr:LuxR C-terminal-related transcriptional regulator [Actinomycetota bacterium]
MSWRTPVYVYASDPMSAAGARAQLMGQPAIELVGPADLDRARVALVVSDAVDEGAARVVHAIQRDGVPRVVLVAARFDEAGVLASVAAGVTSFMRRSEATSARLTEVIREADRSGCQLPEGLIRKAASAGAASVTEAVPAAASGEGPVRSGSTLTLRLTARETEVLRLVADGLDTSDIADQLAYSESTIKGVLAKIMARLEARNRCHAVAIVVREGLI